MIEHFLDPYPDEILYSVWARISDYVQYPHRQDIFIELLGNRQARAIVDFPCHLGYFFDHLPLGHEYTIDILIDQHTLLPFYRPFLSAKQLHQLREQMVIKGGAGIYRNLGGKYFLIHHPKYLRYCPICIEKDKAHFGECYWHRLHQTPGVEVCPIHKTYLENSMVKVGGLFAEQEFISAERAVKFTMPRDAASSHFFPFLMDIASDAWYLLEHPCSVSPPDFFRKQYDALLMQRGFMTRGGTIRLPDIVNAFEGYYSPALLTLLRCDIEESARASTWIPSLRTLRNSLRHPLRHILVIRFLGLTVENFFQQRIEVGKLLDNGPWPCLNPVCEHYQQKSINTYQIGGSYKNKGFSAIFACSCGFTYSRRYSNQSEMVVSPRIKILSYGSVWEAKLKELWQDSQISIKTMPSLLGVSRSTVTSQAARLQIPASRGVHSGSKVRKIQNSKGKGLSWYRTQWMAFMNNENIRTDDKVVSSIYTWLYRHSREWLDEHPLPSKRRWRKRPKKGISPQLLKETKNVDERSYDFITAEAVRTAALQILAVSDIPKKITQKAIVEKVKQVAWLQYYPEKATLTIQALEEVVETSEEFAVRRIRWVVRKYQDECICPTPQAIIRRLRIEYVRHSPMVQRAIDEAMDTLSRLS